MITTKKVVTVTLNPALDLTGHLDTLNVGSVSLVNHSSLHAAGKGVNVAKVLSDLGAEVTVTGFLGRDNQELFCELFNKINVKDKFIRVDGATRINVKLVEKNGDVNDINFPSGTISNTDIEQFEETLFELANDHEYFVIAGSLPNGVSAQLCTHWLQKLHDAGKKVFFDSSQDALAEGINAQPWLIKPNNKELSDLVGHTLDTPEACLHVAQELANKGIENIVVSMGPEGVLWLNQNQWLRSHPPKMNIVSTVGAGDTLVSGFCWGEMQGMEKDELLRFATALSALAVSQVGVGVPSLDELDSLQQHIQLTSLS